MLNVVFTPWRMIHGASRVDLMLQKMKMKILVGLRPKVVNMLLMFWRYVILLNIKDYYLSSVEFFRCNLSHHSTHSSSYA
jgi:hypothetical protein